MAGLQARLFGQAGRTTSETCPQYWGSFGGSTGESYPDRSRTIDARNRGACDPSQVRARNCRILAVARHLISQAPSLDWNKRQNRHERGVISKKWREPLLTWHFLCRESRCRESPLEALRSWSSGSALRSESERRCCRGRRVRRPRCCRSRSRSSRRDKSSHESSRGGTCRPMPPPLGCSLQANPP